MSRQQSSTPRLRFPGFTDAWELRKLGDLLTEKKRPVVLHDDEVYELVTVRRRNEGIVSRGLFKGREILVKNYFQVKAGDYVISKRQVIHGANGIVPSNLDNSIVSNEYLVSVSNRLVQAEFLALFSTTRAMYKNFFLSSYGIDIEKLVFNVDDFKKRAVAIPTLPEQTQIGRFFSLLDRRIALHQRKLENLKLLKKSLLQQMFA